MSSPCNHINIEDNDNDFAMQVNNEPIKELNNGTDVEILNDVAMVNHRDSSTAFNLGSDHKAVRLPILISCQAVQS